MKNFLLHFWTFNVTFLAKYEGKFGLKKIFRSLLGVFRPKMPNKCPFFGRLWRWGVSGEGGPGRCFGDFFGEGVYVKFVPNGPRTSGERGGGHRDPIISGTVSP